MDEKCIIDPERDCIGKEYELKLENRIKNLEDWRDDSKVFHSKFYDWQREQIARDAKLDEQLNNMGDDIKKLVTWQEGQQAKPSKRWDNLLDNLIWLIVGGAVVWILSGMPGV